MTPKSDEEAAQEYAKTHKLDNIDPRCRPQHDSFLAGAAFGRAACERDILEMLRDGGVLISFKGEPGVYLPAMADWLEQRWRGKDE